MSVTETAGLQLLDFDDADAGIIAYSVGGKITGEQAQVIWDRVDAAAAEGRKLRLYCEMQKFPTAEGSVFLEKMKRAGKLLRTIERMVIVGDQRWLWWMVRTLPAFLAAASMRSASARSVAMGFSVSTWRPASSASIEYRAWSSEAVATTTISASEPASMAVRSPNALA